MGTRSLTHVRDEKGEILLTIYRQFDGYESGHGMELAEILREKAIVNGLTGDQSMVANGMGCLAAMIVRDLKEEAGNVYIINPGVNDCGEEYTYEVCFNEFGKPATMKCDNGFIGTPDEFIAMYKDD